MSEFTDQLRRNGEGNRALVVAAALEIERLTADGTVLRELITQFDAAIRRITTELTGQACGGVDTGDNINPETGEPYGPGGHTGWLLASEAKKLREERDRYKADLEWLIDNGMTGKDIHFALTQKDCPEHLRKRLEGKTCTQNSCSITYSERWDFPAKPGD